MKDRKTIIEIFFVVIIIVVFASFLFFQFYKIKTHVRNNIREGNIADIQKALLFYYNSTHSYPLSEGECINKNSSITEKVEKIKLVNKIPEDPVWPSDKPSLIDDKGIPDKDSTNFCFWYVSGGKNYKLFYYLEPQVDTGEGGMVTTTDKEVR